MRQLTVARISVLRENSKIGGQSQTKPFSLSQNNGIK